MIMLDVVQRGILIEKRSADPLERFGASYELIAGLSQFYWYKRKQRDRVISA